MRIHNTPSPRRPSRSQYRPNPVIILDLDMGEVFDLHRDDYFVIARRPKLLN